MYYTTHNGEDSRKAKNNMVEHMTSMGQARKKGTGFSLGEKTKGKRALGRPRRKWK